MASGSFRFDRFLLDPDDRQLRRDGAPVELNARYLDALALLVREPGRLVSKDRFMEEIWRGIPVTDEALTQCIRTLRRQLGDDAARPRFIETVPKHGYRFIAAVETVGDEAAPSPAAPAPAATGRAHGWREVLLSGGTGTIGGGIAGLLGGLFYGFAGAAEPLAPGMGAASVLLVLICLTVAVALVGGAGVSLGIAAAGLLPGPHWRWAMLGGAAGGAIVGGIVKLLGLDAFNLLLGRSPGDITGALEGLLIGAAVGFGAWVSGRNALSLRLSMLAAGGAGAASGILIALTGGRMMGGSLDLLARALPGSRLRLDQIGALFGEAGFGTISQVVTGALEGGLFAAGIVGGMILGRRTLAPGPQADGTSGSLSH